jgi:hypothetical protein
MLKKKKVLERIEMRIALILQTLQHPVALCRSNVWCRLSAYAQISPLLHFFIVFYLYYIFRPNWPSSGLPIGFAL